MWFPEHLEDTSLIFIHVCPLQKFNVMFVYPEKATKFFEIFTLLLSVCTAGLMYCTVDKSKVKISQNFVASSEYMNFTFKITFIVC